MNRSNARQTRDKLMNFRVSEAEKKVWEAEADRRDVTLSQLIRHVMNDVCKKRKKPKKRA